MPTVHAFEFLAAPEKHPLAKVVVTFGDDAFLRREGLAAVKQQFAGAGADVDSPSCVQFDAEERQLEWRDIHDELSSGSLFGSGQQMVLVQRADSFISAQRAKLEDYVARPKATSCLVLDVTNWMATTKLYKSLDKDGLQIHCAAPTKGGKSKNVDESKVCKWLVSRATQAHGIKLKPIAAEMLVELVGPHLGLLDQDLAKLALYVSDDKEVTGDLVQSAIGGWRAKSSFDAINAALDGNAEQALVQLDHLMQAGEHPLALLGSIAWTLRRYATATRIYQAAHRRGKRPALADVLTEAGFTSWQPGGIPGAEQRLKRLGRDRAGQLLHWILETDLALKGTHSDERRSRFLLEQLFLKLAQPNPTQRAAAT